MVWLVLHAFAISFWAWTFWGSIAVLDRGNPKNNLGLAVLVAAVADIAANGLGDIYYLIAWLLFTIRLTTWYYHLTLLGSIVVAAITVFVPYLIGPWIINSFIGDSELRAYLLIYGLPLVTFAAAIISAIRRSRARTAERLAGTSDVATTLLPQARVSRWRKTTAAKLAKPPTAPAAAVVIQAPLRAPSPQAPPTDEPRFLV